MFFRVPVPVRCVVYRLWSPKVKESIIGMSYFRGPVPNKAQVYNITKYNNKI